MSLLDRMLTLSLLDIPSALSQLDEPEQVRDAVLSEIGGVLEAAGAELRQLQRSRDDLLNNRRAAEKEADAKQTALNQAAEAEKVALGKQAAALKEALERLDEQIAEQNRDEAALHKQVARLQEIRRQAAEWSPRRLEDGKNATASNADKSSKEKITATASTSSSTAKPKVERSAEQPGQAQTEVDANDPFTKMKRLKERMEAFQSRNAIDEAELRAFEAEKAIAEEETKQAIEETLREMKKKLNRG